MNFERYKNRVQQLNIEMGTLKINRDRMMIGSAGCMLANQCMGQFMGSDGDILVATSGVLGITLGVNALIKHYKLCITNQKYQIVQQVYYSKEKQKTYKKDN